MKRTILLLLAGVALYSCQTTKSVLTNDFIQGTSYSGTLPCEDCNGISQVVILDSNNRFRLSETYMDNQPLQKCVEKCGNWALQDGKVILYTDNSPLAHYAIAGNNLVYLEQASLDLKDRKYNGQGMLARKHLIRSKKINPNYLQGIDIVAFGAEPSWSLDISHHKAIQFSVPGLDAPVAFSPVAPVLKGDSIIYTIVSASEQMQVILSPGYCSDNVSDNLYDYKVTVNFRGNTYKGCGAIMNADGTLTGTWILNGIEGASKNWQQQPFLVVDLDAQKFYGNTGCNDISGTARLRGEKVCFSDINYHSQKECNGYDETAFIDAIIKCNGFTIEQGILQLSQDGKQVMNFTRHVEDHP